VAAQVPGFAAQYVFTALCTRLVISAWSGSGPAAPCRLPRCVHVVGPVFS
jgi:hypothetical protein